MNKYQIKMGLLIIITNYSSILGKAGNDVKQNEIETSPFTTYVEVSPIKDGRLTDIEGYSHSSYDEINPNTTTYSSSYDEINPNTTTYK